MLQPRRERSSATPRWRSIRSWKFAKSTDELLSAASRRALLIRHQDAGFRVIRCRDVVKRNVNIIAFRASVLDEHHGDALGNWPLHLGRTSFDPGNLRVWHFASSLERGTSRILHGQNDALWPSLCLQVALLDCSRPGGQSIAPYVLVLQTHAFCHSAPD